METYYSILEEIKTEEEKMILLLTSGFLNIYSLYTFNEFYYNRCKLLKDIIDGMDAKDRNRISYIELFKKIKSIGMFINEMEKQYRNGNTIDVNEIRNYLVSGNPVKEEIKMESKLVQVSEPKQEIKKETMLKSVKNFESKSDIKIESEQQEQNSFDLPVKNESAKDKKTDAKILLEQMKQKLLENTQKKELRTRVLESLSKQPKEEEFFDDFDLEVGTSYKKAA